MTIDKRGTLVLVTGGSGFIATYCIAALLNDGYPVRTTVRSLKREDEIRKWLLKTGANLERLTFAEADLMSDKGWQEACHGASYVLHVASPFPETTPKHEDELIVPAREGTLRVLKFAKEAGVKRVVQTSSFAAVAYGHPATKTSFDETDWTDPTSSDASAYYRSKTLAERAAWKFIEEQTIIEGSPKMELATICPVAVMGPVLGADFATSILLVKRLMNGEMPGCPKISFGIVDVRDVATLHLLAMTSPSAAGQRFIAAAPPPLTVKEMSLALKREMGDQKARKCPTWEVPSFLVRLFSYVDPGAKLILEELDRVRGMSSQKARTLLGWDPRGADEALKATAESLIAEGVVKF